MADLTAWQARATRYVHAKGWQHPDAEDLVQEMLCYVLQHPATVLNIDYVYLSARARHDPFRGADRVRRSHLELAVEIPRVTVYDPSPEDLALAWLEDQLDTLDPRTRTLLSVAALDATPPEDLWWPPLLWEVTWL